MHNVFEEISLVIIAVALVAGAMRLLKQPLIIAYILAGVLVGGSALGIIHDADTFSVFSQFGVVLLLFIIGLGLNPNVMRETGKTAITIGGLQMLITTSIGAGIASLLGLGTREALIAGLAVSFSSTIIILKLIGDKKELSRLYGKLAVGILLVQDVIAALALVFIGSAENGGFDALTLVQMASYALIIGAALYIFSVHTLPKMRKFLAGSQEMLFIFAIAWGFGMGLVLERAGFSLEVGALVAGASLATQNYAQEMASRLKPLRDFFLVLFFAQIGSQLDLSTLGEIWPLALALSVVATVVKPHIVYLLMTFIGYSNRTGFSTGSAMAQISEFSIIFVLLASSAGVVADSTASAITLVAIISIAVSSYFITYADWLYEYLQPYTTRIGLRPGYVTESKSKKNLHPDVFVVGYQKGGSEFGKLFSKLKRRYLVIDYDPDVIDTLSHTKHPFVFGDATDLEFLEEIEMPSAKMVISTLSSQPINLSLLAYLKKAKSKASFVCSAETVDQAQDLYKAGASYVMLPHYIGSSQLTHFIEEHGFSKTKFKKMRTESTNIV